MAKSLTQLKKQIAVLERQAEVLRKKEAKDVIARMKDAIAHYELTAQDLGFSSAATPRKAAAKGSAARKPGRRKGAGKIKFRDAAGNTWTGHGRRPQWFLDALASGKSADDMAA